MPTFIGLIYCFAAQAHASDPHLPQPLEERVTSSVSLASVIADWRPFVEIELWRASDFIPVAQFSSDWAKGFSPRAGRNVALVRNRATAGVESAQWRIGYEIRQGASLVTDRETLEMVRRYKQRLAPAEPGVFSANASYRNWSARGLRIGRTIDGPVIAGRPVRASISAALYGDSSYRRNDVSGTVRYLGAGDYAFNASKLDIDSRAQLPFMNGRPEASGISVSIAAEVPLSEAWTLNVEVDDLWSRMRWRNLPVSRQTINSDVTSTDGGGVLNYRPLLSGRNEQIDSSISLPHYGLAELSYRAGDWRYAAQVEQYASNTIPTFSIGRHFSWGNVTTKIETRFNTFGLGYAFGNFRMLLQTDTLQQDKAKAQAVQISYARSF